MNLYFEFFSRNNHFWRNLNFNAFPFLSFPDASLEAGAVMDDDEGAAVDHHLDARSLGKPDLLAHHRHLHLRRSRHAALRQDLHRRKLLSRSGAKVSRAGNLTKSPEGKS